MFVEAFERGFAAGAKQLLRPGADDEVLGYLYNF